MSMQVASRIGGHLRTASNHASLNTVKYISCSFTDFQTTKMRVVELQEFGSRSKNVVDTMNLTVGAPNLSFSSERDVTPQEPVFCVSEVPVPKPSGTEVLVKVKSTAVNPIDCMMARGYGKRIMCPYGSPDLVLGRDFSGVVVQNGSCASKFRIGDEVYGALSPWTSVSGWNPKYGSYSEYVVLRQDQIALKPSNVDHTSAVGIPYSALTAYEAFIEDVLNWYEPGKDALFVHGGSGVIGSFTIQVLKEKGFKVFTSCSFKNAHFVQNLGVDGWVDYVQSSHPPESLANLRNYLPNGVPKGSISAVLDVVGTEATKQTSMEMLRPNAGSFYVTLRPPPIPLMDRHGVLLGSLFSAVEFCKVLSGSMKKGILEKWGMFRDLGSNGTTLAQITKLIEQNVVKPHVDRVFEGLEQVGAAHAHLESGKACGKVVIRVSEGS